MYGMSSPIVEILGNGSVAGGRKREAEDSASCQTRRTHNQQHAPSGSHFCPLEVVNTVESYHSLLRSPILSSVRSVTMAHNRTPANLDSLSLSDAEADDTEDLFASPCVKSKEAHSGTIAQTSTDAIRPQDPELAEETLAAHEASLRRELSSLRSMNQVITGITSSLEKAKSNMETVSATVSNASTLLSTWTRILSQTEHNQRLILNPNWSGATQDIADGENELVLRQQERQRREAEEARRAREREAAREEEERRRTVEPVKGSRGKGKALSTGRGRASSSGYGMGGSGGGKGTTRGPSTTGRSGAGLGRGLGGSRGRSRGL